MTKQLDLFYCGFRLTQDKRYQVVDLCRSCSRGLRNWIRKPKNKYRFRPAKIIAQ